MYQKILYFIILMVLASILIEANHQNGVNMDELGLPIYINTSKAIPTITKTPFILYADLVGLQLVQNTGKYIQFIPKLGNSVYAIGGFLGNKLHKLCKQYLLINQDPHGSSGVVVDGEVFSITGMNVFCDVTLGSYENAIKYPYGTALLMQPVRVGHLPNILFTPMERILLSGEITKPNTTSITQTVNTFSWYDSIFISFEFHSYDGRYVDPDGNKVALSRALVTHRPYNTISIKQFSAFKKALGDNGRAIQTTLPTFSGKNRIVKTSKQILPIINPFSLIGYPSELIYLVFYRIVAFLRVLLKR